MTPPPDALAMLLTVSLVAFLLVVVTGLWALIRRDHPPRLLDRPSWTDQLLSPEEQLQLKQELVEQTLSYGHTPSVAESQDRERILVRYAVGRALDRMEHEYRIARYRAGAA